MEKCLFSATVFGFRQQCNAQLQPLSTQEMKLYLDLGVTSFAAEISVQDMERLVSHMILMIDQAKLKGAPHADQG